MRSKLLVGMVLAATVLSLAGCGVKEKKETKTKKVSVSEDSGRTLEERREADFKAFCEPGAVLTKNCFYAAPVTEEHIIQWSHDGKELDRYDSAMGVEAGSDKRLILDDYVEGDMEDRTDLYSVPVKQTESGETVLWEQKEKVASCECEEGAGAYLYEPYLVYCENENTLTRLNLETKEKKTIQFEMADSEVYNFSLMDGQLYLVDRAPRTAPGDAVYRIQIDDWTSEKLYERKERGEEFIGQLCVEGKYLFVAMGIYDGDEDDDNPYDDYGRVDTYSYDRIECYDMEQKKTVGQLSFDEVKSFLEKEMGDVGVFRSITQYRMFSYEGRLYLALDGVLETEEADGITYTHRQILFSCLQGEMTKLRYEREVSEWWYENCESQKWQKEPPYEVDCYGDFLTAFGDVFYFKYLDKQDKEHLMGYRLDTKKWEEVPESELAYRMFEAMGFFYD